MTGTCAPSANNAAVPYEVTPRSCGFGPEARGPVEGGIVMQQLLYAPEVRSIEDVEIAEAPVKDAELNLAKQLIAQIWDIEAFPDVRPLIEALAKP